MYLNKIFIKNYGKILAGFFFSRFRFAKKYLPEKRFWELVTKNFFVEEEFTFIQVGANDGTSFDILYDIVKLRKSSGIVIEPLPDFFEQLCNTYQNFPSVIKVNKAVHSTLRTVNIYRVHPKKQHLAPDWAKGIASLDPNHHKKSNTSSDLIIPEPVEAAPLMEIVLQDYKKKIVDLLQIDVEGFDYEVLKMLDFKTIKPSIIKYEYVNLCNEDKASSRKFLKQNGYYLFLVGDDMVGVILGKVIL